MNATRRSLALLGGLLLVAGCQAAKPDGTRVAIEQADAAVHEADAHLDRVLDLNGRIQQRADRLERMRRDELRAHK